MASRAAILRWVVPSRRRLLVYVALLPVAVGALVLAVRTGWLESRVFFFPSRAAFATPPGVTDAAIPVPGGGTLHAWLIPPRRPVVGGPPPVVLHAHGNAGNVADHAAFTEWLADHGFAVLAFDYRGYGRSADPPGGLSRRTVLEDTRATLAWLRTQEAIDPSRIAILGQSLGATPALIAAAEAPDVRAVVAVSGFSSWRAIARDHAGLMGATLVTGGLDAEDAAAALRGRPVLVVHGGLDRIVPPHHATRLASAAGVSALIVPGREHNDMLVDDEVTQRRIAAFLSEALAAPPAPR